MEKDLFRNRVRLRHLDCFVSVAQTRHLGKAAVRLRLTQPAVSKTLNELEDIVGVQLLERNRLGARLTRQGEAFLAHAVAVLGALDAAGASVLAEQAPVDELVRVGVLPTVAADLLPAAAAEFQGRRRHARVAVQTARNSDLVQMLKAGEIDFAVARMTDPEMIAGLSFELLYMEPLALVVRPGHPLAAPGAVSLTDVADYPAVVLPPGTVPRQHAESFLRSRGLKLPANCLETLSVSLSREMVRQSNAIWFAPLGAVRADLQDGGLVRLAVPTDGTEEPVGLLHRSEGTIAEPATLMMTLLRELAAARRSTAT
jgi:pca operon transcription factor PcaQ